MDPFSSPIFSMPQNKKVRGNNAKEMKSKTASFI